MSTIVAVCFLGPGHNKVLSGVAGGTSIAGLFTWGYAWIVGLSGLVIGGYANRINNTNARAVFLESI